MWMFKVLLRETISIIKYLHSLNIIHRDIKPENLLLDNNFRIKLCDYGWATHYNNNEHINTFCGTPEYVAPEIIKKEFYDEKIDIWSIGVLLFEMICNYSPFSDKNNNERFKNIIKGKINWPKNINFKAKKLIEKILKINPNERLSLNDILNDDFVIEYKEIKPELKVMEISKKEIILSHMMNNKKIENFNNEIDNIIDSDDNDSTNEFSMERDDYYKNECKNLKLQIMKIDSERLSFKKKYLENENIKNENDNLKKELNNLKNENLILEKKINERKELIEEN
jgi:serine/threonine protein kinase